ILPFAQVAERTAVARRLVEEVLGAVARQNEPEPLVAHQPLDRSVHRVRHLAVSFVRRTSVRSPPIPTNPIIGRTAGLVRLLPNRRRDYKRGRAPAESRRREALQSCEAVGQNVKWPPTRTSRPITIADGRPSDEPTVVTALVTALLLKRLKMSTVGSNRT